jgi:calcineurin-like phosphoesterase family protein
MIFFTSDTHFGHFNVIEYSRRPFNTSQEMTRELIRRWNAVVSEGDIVYHLGDVSFLRPTRTMDILYQLKGKKHLIRGNHDKRVNKWGEPFHTVQHYHELNAGRQKIMLCHYPFDTWKGAHRGNWHLHGHSHGSLKTVRTNRLDVGVDCHDYRPVSIDEVADFMRDQPPHSPVGHHKGR